MSYPLAHKWAVSRHTPIRSLPSARTNSPSSSKLPPHLLPPPAEFSSKSIGPAGALPISAPSNRQTCAKPFARDLAVAAEMRVDELDAALRGHRQVMRDEGCALVAQPFLRRGEIDQVRSVDDRGPQPVEFAKFAELMPGCCVVGSRAPTARIAGEDLDALALRGECFSDALAEAAADADVKAEPHPLPFSAFASSSATLLFRRASACIGTSSSWPSIDSWICSAATARCAVCGNASNWPLMRCGASSGNGGRSSSERNPNASKNSLVVP